MTLLLERSMGDTDLSSRSRLFHSAAAECRKDLLPYLASSTYDINTLVYLQCNLQSGDYLLNVLPAHFIFNITFILFVD